MELLSTIGFGIGTLLTGAATLVASLFAVPVAEAPEIPETAPQVVVSGGPTTNVTNVTEVTNEYFVDERTTEQVSGGVSLDLFYRSLDSLRDDLNDTIDEETDGSGGGGGGGLTDISGESIEDLADVGAMTKAFGDLFSWNGSEWLNIATSTLGISLSDTTGTLPATRGGTGFASYATGDLLYADSATSLTRLPAGSAGQVLKISGGVPSWGADATGSGGSGAFSTSSDSLSIYPTDTADVVIIGASATSTTGNILEVSGNSLLRGLTTSYGLVSAPRFSATSTTASSFPYASTTGISAAYASSTNLFAGLLTLGADTISDLTGAGLTISGNALTLDASGNWTGTFDGQEGSYYLANSFSTTSANYWQGTRDFFSTTSANHWQTTRDFFSTTSADYFVTQRNFFSTSSADAWKSVRDFFSTTSASYFLSVNQGAAFSTTSANYWETQQTARTADDLTNNSIEDLSDVATMTENFGDLLGWNGSTWTDFATSSLGLPTFADIANFTTFAWPFTPATSWNATSTLLSLQGGIMSNASSTLHQLRTTYASSSYISSVTASSTNLLTGLFTLGADTVSDLTGSGLSVVGNALTVSTSGDWTGTFDGFEGAYYLANGFSTTSADNWKNNRNFFSTSSADYWETQQTARTADDLTNNSIEDLSDVATMTENFGDLLYWNGSSWADIATSSLGLVTSAFPYTPATSWNATSTLIQFQGGIMSNASSTLHQLRTTYASSTYLSTATASTTNLIVNLANSLLRTDASGQLSVTTIGTGLSFDGTTLSSSITQSAASKWATTTGAFSGITPAGASTVGIGTSTPRALLHLATSTAPQIALSDAFAATASWVVRAISGNLFFASATPSTLATGTTPVVMISEAGNFGIGTANPAYPFQVRNAASFLRLDSTSHGNLNFTFSGSGANTNRRFTIGTDNASPDLELTTSGGDIFLTPSAGGKVGISTTTPMWALQIASTSGPQLALSDGSLTSDHWTVRSIMGNLFFATASPSTFATSTLAAFSITSNGVALANQFCDTTQDICFNPNPAGFAQFKNKADSAYVPVAADYYFTSAGNVYFGGSSLVNDSTSNSFLVGGNIITGQGRAGFGTSTPGTKLSVNGDAVVAGFVTGRLFTATSTAAASTFPYASSTYLSVSGTASTSALIVSSLNCTGANGGALTATAGVITCTDDDSGGGIASAASKWATSTTDSTAIHLAGAARVGIGTTSPLAELNVFAAVTPEVRIGVSADTSSTRYTFYENNTLMASLIALGSNFSNAARANDLEISAASGDISLRPGGSEAAIFKSDGTVGIGTTTPGGKLGVQGNVFLAGNIISTSSAASVFPYASSTYISSAAASTSALTLAGIGSATNNILTVAPTGAVTASSLSALGATTFAWPFTPAASWNATSTLIQFNGGIMANASSTLHQLRTTYASSTYLSAGTASTSALIVSALPNSLLRTDSGGAVANTTIGAGLSFSGGTLSSSITQSAASKWATSSASATSIYTAGATAVGIGSSTPILPLSIQGNGVYAGHQYNVALFTGTTVGPGILFGGNGTYDGNLWQLVALGSSNSSLGAPGGFAIADRTNSISRLTIDSSGRVGFGTTSPWGKVSITNTGTGPSFIVEDSTSPDSTPFVIDDSGNVGIGTSSPTNELTITSGGLQITGATTNQSGVPSLYIGTNGTTATIASANSGVAGLALDLRGYPITFSSSQTGAELGRFATNGNFGVGTSTPGSAFSLQGNQFVAGNIVSTSSAASIFPYASTTGITASYASTSALVISGIGSAANGCLAVSATGAVSATACGSVSAASKWATTTGTFRGIAPAGAVAVGIGTTTPKALLHLSTSTAPQLVLSDENSGTSPWTFRSINGNLYFATASPSTFATSTNTRFSIASSGNVGVGVATPAYRLDINTLGFQSIDGIRLAASDSHTLEIRPSMSAGSNNAITQAGDTGIIFHNGSQDTGAFVLAPWATGPSGLRMTSTGQVGIGTSSPIDLLSIYSSATAGAINIGTWDSLRNGISLNGHDASSGTGYNILSGVGDLNLYLNRPSGNAIKFREANSATDQLTLLTGGGVTVPDGNFSVCTGGACPSGNPSGNGNIVAETAIGIASSTPFAGLAIASGKAVVVAENTLATSTSMTIDWRNGNQQLVRIGTSATTISFTGFIEGQKLVLTVCNPASGTTGALSWGTQVLWAGASAPTQTTTNNKCDVWSFLATRATSTLKIFGAQNANF